MSFNNNARKIRNPEAPLRERVWALNSCISLLSFTTVFSYHELRTKHMAWPDKNPTEVQLLAAINALEIIRNKHLEKLRAFERKRIRQKMLGQRHPRKADLEALWHNDDAEDNAT